MKTAKEIEIEFRSDLINLLKKYDAEINLVDYGSDYMPDKQMQVTIPAQYVNDERVADFSQFDLGTWADSKDIVAL